jgi:flagellar hook-length control protein FliK
MDEALQGDEGTTPVTEPARKPDASTPAQAFAVGSQLAQQGGPLPGSAPRDVSDRGQPADKPQDRTPSAVDADGSISQGAAAKAGGDSQTPLTQSAPGQAASSPPVVPTLVVPQQVLAQAQSQGSQAPVTSLPQGASAATIEGAAASVKNEPVTKGKLAVLERSESLVTSGQKGESDPAPPSPHQGPQALAEARVSQTALSQPRADAPALPHLKLAGQDAPAELQQRVNVMLADKLQQAEIQLDPLGLGKMKIQIQLGQDSQASVSFVVQHGQTREMLEQAMPRLREMLAGQGIQLGQTSVQQQTQQQAQQQSQQQAQGFAGQEGGHGAQHEVENGVTRLSLSMDAANESGIDFYA